MAADQSIIHLTETGPYAGRPFCTVNKAVALAAGERFAHVPYSRVDEFLALPQICPACLHEWNAAGGDDDGAEEGQ